jgi:hypothetical protein
MKVISKCKCGISFVRQTGYIIKCPTCLMREKNAMLNYCPYCRHVFHSGKFSWQFIEAKTRQCMFCGKVTVMPNIKITAEVDGKQVPLETVSTETFEAIKALEKPKEIPAIAIGNYKGELHNRRLFIKINKSIKDPIAKYNATMIVINPKNGQVVNWWTGNRSDDRKYYENVRPL